MPALRSTPLLMIAVAALVASSACQPLAPAAPTSSPTQPTAAPAQAAASAPQPTAAAQTTAAAQPTIAPQATDATQPMGVAHQSAATPTPQSPAESAPAVAPPKPSPMPLPFVPTSTLSTLSAEQASVIGAARSALAAADDARALRLLEPLKDQLSDEQQQEVRLLYGQALVGDQQFDNALAVSEQLLASTTRQDLISASRLLKGQALRGLDRFDEAATEMRTVADANPLVAAAVRLELEDMWLSANRPDEAAVDGQKGLDAAEARLLKIDIAEKLGTAEVALNNTDAAMDAYRQLLTAAGSKGYLGEQLYNLAVGTSQLGRTDDAINALRTSISQFPRSRKAPDAVALLEQLGGMRDEDRFYAGIIRYLFWNFRGAREDFDAYLSAFPDGDNAIEARFYRGLSSTSADETTQLLQLASDVPDDDFAPMALLEAGKAQEELGDYKTAANIFESLVAKYPTRDAGMAGAFRLGLAHVMLGEFDTAVSVWNDLLGRDPQPDVRAQVLYWSGKVLSENGDSTAAEEKYRAAAAVRPVDYYVIRAQVALDPPPSSTSFDLTSVTPADEAELARWYAARGLDLAADAKAASQDPAYIRATALVEHGLYKEANWEYEIFLTTYADKPDRLYWLAARFGEMGLPNAELKLGTAALNAATAEGHVSVLDVPRALARVASPLVFPDLVSTISKQRGLDPLLFTSLMHQESDYDSYVESVAKAKGLTQIIPKTGNEIAAALGVNNFVQDDLYHPTTNVRFGAYYFAARLRRNGSIARGLASYNAGDGNVDTWTLPGREDPDVFTEYVPFAETNDYVKAILKYWWINRYIWANGN